MDLEGEAWHRTTSNSTIMEEGTSWFSANAFAGAVSSAHETFTHNHVIDIGVTNYQMCQEGDSDVVWTSNDFAISGNLGGGEAEMGSNNCFGLTFTGNNVTLANSSMFGMWEFASPTVAKHHQQHLTYR